MRLAAGLGVALGALGWASDTGLAAHQQTPPPRISGRVVDAATGEGVEGASVTLVRLDTTAAVASSAENPTRIEVATDAAGLFHVERAHDGAYELTIAHLAYGSFSEPLVLTDEDPISLRVALSHSAIALSPVVVEAATRESRLSRARGRALRRVTSEELAPVARTGIHLVGALAQLLPGMRAQSGRSQPGELDRKSVV